MAALMASSPVSRETSQAALSLTSGGKLSKQPAPQGKVLGDKHGGQLKAGPPAQQLQARRGLWRDCSERVWAAPTHAWVAAGGQRGVDFEDPQMPSRRSGFWGQFPRGECPAGRLGLWGP